MAISTITRDLAWPGAERSERRAGSSARLGAPIWPADPDPGPESNTARRASDDFAWAWLSLAALAARP